MPTRPLLPDGTITRVEAAAILGISLNKVSKMLTDGRLQGPAGLGASTAAAGVTRSKR